MEELWKDIVGFEGLYQIRNCGRVKSLERKSFNGKHLKEKILKIQLNSHGYSSVVLRKNNKSYTKEVHRLVALAFIPNPENLPQVSHKDETRTNSCVNNLKWSTVIDNCNMPLRKKRSSENINIHHCGKDNYFYDKHYSGGENPRALPVICEEKYFSCVLDCAQFYEANPVMLRRWLKSGKLPKQWVEKGLRYAK